jgi:hypothetical protein
MNTTVNCFLKKSMKKFGDCDRSICAKHIGDPVCKKPNELGNYKKGDPVYGGIAFFE